MDDSSISSQDISFDSFSEDDLPVHTEDTGKYDMILRIGKWEKEIDLAKFQGGFLSDWYAEYGSPGALLDLTGRKMDFIVEKWHLLRDFRVWESLNSLVFYGHSEYGCKIREKYEGELDPIYYYDIAPLLRTVGTAYPEWQLFTVLDRRVPQEERLQVARTVGDIVRREGMSLSFSLLPREAEELLLMMVRQANDEEAMRDSIQGILHSAFLLAMTEKGGGNQVFFSTESHVSSMNRMRGYGTEIGPQGYHEILTGLNWSYIIWEDIEALFLAQEGWDPQTPALRKVQYFLGNTRASPSFQFELREKSMHVRAHAIPLLYNIAVGELGSLDVLESHSKHHSAFPNTEDKAYRNQYAELLRMGSIASYITQAALLAPASVGKSWKEVKLDPSKAQDHVDYMIHTLGLFAMSRLESILWERPLNTFGRMFLSRLAETIDKKRDLIREARTMSIWELAASDKHGMLLRNLPSTKDPYFFK